MWTKPASSSTGCASLVAPDTRASTSISRGRPCNGFARAGSIAPSPTRTMRMPSKPPGCRGSARSRRDLDHPQSDRAEAALVVRAGHLAMVERRVEDLVGDPHLLRDLPDRAVGSGSL